MLARNKHLIAGPLKFGTLEWNFHMLNQNHSSLAQCKREVRKMWRKAAKGYVCPFAVYDERDAADKVWPDWIVAK